MHSALSEAAEVKIGRNHVVTEGMDLDEFTKKEIICQTLQLQVGIQSVHETDILLLRKAIHKLRLEHVQWFSVSILIQAMRRGQIFSV